MLGYTGQRLDAESGLMALGNGERYYSPELGRFIQQDTFTGSLSMPQTLNRFAYAVNSPFRYKDPTGNIIESVWDFASLVVGVGQFSYNISEGNYGSAALDAVGIIADTAALLLPVVPGGAGFAIRASRTAAYGIKALQTVDRAVNIYQATTAAGEEFGKGNLGMGALNTAFALLGAKGFSDSAKSFSKIEDFNAGTGKAPSYFKEYDKLSQDIEKIKNFGQTVGDYTNAVGRGIKKGLRESNGNLYNGLPIDPIIKISGEVKQTRLERFLSKGTLAREKSTYRLRKISTDDAKMKDFLSQWTDVAGNAKYKKGDFSIHHLISVEDASIGKLPVMLKAEELGYNINRRSNLMPLPNKVDVSKGTGLPLHDNRHIAEYSEAITERVTNLDDKFRRGMLNDEDILNGLSEIEDSLRNDLLNRALKLQNHDPNF